jgi:hypothetical protein
MRDGLYIVDRKGIYAAFVMHGDVVTQCAPILRNNIDHWKHVAKWVPTAFDPDPPAEVEDEYPPAWHVGCV